VLTRVSSFTMELLINLMLFISVSEWGRASHAHRCLLTHTNVDTQLAQSTNVDTIFQGFWPCFGTAPRAV
jgi:hypothetical protein